LLRMRSMVRNVRDVFDVELYTNSAPHKESEYCKELLESPNGMTVRPFSAEAVLRKDSTRVTFIP